MMEPRISEKATEMFAVQPQIDTTGLCSEKQDQQAVLSDRGLDKKRAKDKKRLASEFTQAMQGNLQYLEHTLEHGSSAQKELAKQRRRMLKDVLKATTEPSTSIEERLKYLQSKFVQLIQEQNKQDKDMLVVQAQLDAAEQQVATGRADLQRANQKVDRLQQLARTLQKENKLTADEVQMRKEQLDKFRAATQAIQEKIDSHGQDSMKILQENKSLMEENHNLRSKLAEMAQLLADNQEKLEGLRSAQTQQLQDIQEKLSQQTDFIKRSQELQTHVSTVLDENKVLSEQVQALDLQNKKLELLNAEYKQQLEGCRSQMKDMESSLGAASKLMKVVEKLQHDMADYQKQMPVVLKERQLLREQAVLLQKQLDAQSNELKRTQLQKARLEGLCRALQARLGGATASQSQQSIAAVQPEDSAADDGEVAAICSKVVQAAIDAVVSTYRSS